jgi:hypothetical protein
MTPESRSELLTALVTTAQAYLDRHPEANARDLVELLRWLGDYSTAHPDSPTAVMELLHWMREHMDTSSSHTSGDRFEVSAGHAGPALTLVRGPGKAAL